MKRILALLLAVSCLAGLAGCSRTSSSGASGSGTQLAAPSYPKMAPYPDPTDYLPSDGSWSEEAEEKFQAAAEAWQASREAQRNRPEADPDTMAAYLRASIPQLLGGAAGENRVCSPLSVYMALAMLAECTDGESRQQLLTLLGSDSLDALHTQTQALWNTNYCDDGAVTSLLASSVWLSDRFDYTQQTLDNLAQYDYASAYRGVMGDAAYNQMLRDWLNQQTGDRLTEQAQGLELDAQTCFALISTINYRAKWCEEFNAANTASAPFHSPSGEATCEYMKQTNTQAYYWSDGFAAIEKPLEGSGSMWLLLPDEGVTPEELLAQPAALDFLLRGGEGTESKYVQVHLSLPKFDAASSLELPACLTALGVTDVFDSTQADFSPLSPSSDGMYVSRAQHAARVTVDEEGVTAAAYTAIVGAGAGMPPDEEVDFVLDRPFLFAITGTDGLPLFVGIVNQP